MSQGMKTTYLRWHRGIAILCIDRGISGPGSGFLAQLELRLCHRKDSEESLRQNLVQNQLPCGERIPPLLEPRMTYLLSSYIGMWKNSSFVPLLLPPSRLSFYSPPLDPSATGYGL